jgi:hypothetical protein
MQTLPSIPLRLKQLVPHTEFYGITHLGAAFIRAAIQ